MKTQFILCTLTAGVALSVQAKDQRPNIVMIIGDDISRDDFGCYGHPLVKTPNIDALAEDGMRFNSMFLTASSSSPSRCSIITGRYPHNTGACELHSPIGPEQVFFPEVLRQAGYYTALAGKFHIGGKTIEPEGPAVRAFDRAGGSRNDGGGTSGAKMWVPYLQERPKDKPFFMWFASHDAHRNFWDKELLVPPYDPDDVVPPIYNVNAPATRKDYAGYYNEVTRLDHYVGEVIAELKRQGVYENTFIFVMADNGRPFPRAKSHVYESGILTPFIVHYPKGIKQPGTVCNSVVSIIDLAPTLLSLAGTKIGETFQGRSFLNLIENPNARFRTYAFAEHNWHVSEAYERMVATDRYLLIENKRPQLPVKSNMTTPTGRDLRTAHENGTATEFQARILAVPQPEVLLFDRIADPLQQHDIAADHPEIVTTLLNVLHRWQDQTDDTVPEYLKPDRGKEKTVNYMDRVEMPGASRGAKTCKNSGPF